MKRITIAAALVATFVGVAGSFSVAPNASGASAFSCTEGFESGVGAWRSWWTGPVGQSTSAAHSGSAALLAEGPRPTAILDANAGCAADSVSLWVRPTTGTARVHLKLIGPLGQGDQVVGPFVVSDWTRLEASASTIPGLGQVVQVGVEATVDPGASLLVDDVILSGPGSPTTVAPTPAGSCFDTFTTGTDGWLRWWSGWLEHQPSPGVLVLHPPGRNAEPGPATAEKLISASTCGPITSLSARFRAPLGTANLYVKVTDVATGASTVNAVAIGSAWTDVSLPMVIDRNAFVRFELYPSAPFDPVEVDDIRFNEATSEIRPTTPLTTPPTIAPAAAYPCADEEFENFSSGGWSEWLPGSQLFLGDGLVSMSGSPGSMQRVVAPTECAGAITGMEMLLTSNGVSDVFVKTIDQITNETTVYGPWRALWGGSIVRIPVRIQGPTFVGIEAYPETVGILDGKPRTNGVTVDRISLLSDRPSPTTTLAECYVDEFNDRTGGGFDRLGDGPILPAYPAVGYLETTDGLYFDGVGDRCTVPVADALLTVKGPAGATFTARSNGFLRATVTLTGAEQDIVVALGQPQQQFSFKATASGSSVPIRLERFALRSRSPKPAGGVPGAPTIVSLDRSDRNVAFLRFADTSISYQLSGSLPDAGSSTAVTSKGTEGVLGLYAAPEREWVAAVRGCNAHGCGPAITVRIP